MRLFAQAISEEERKSPLETYDPSQVVIDSSYTGPHLPQNEDGDYFLTLDFMKSLIETFKAQGKLHRKYAMIVCFLHFCLLPPFQLICKFYKYIRQLPSLVDIEVPDVSSLFCT